MPVAAVVVECGRARRRKDDAAGGVQGQAGPAIGAAGMPEGLRRPRLVTKLARPGDGVKGPAQFAGANVKGADVTVGRRQELAYRAAHDQQVAEYHARRRQLHGQRIGIPVQVLPQVDFSLLAEPGDRPSGARVQGVEVMANADEQPRVPARRPVGKAAHPVTSQRPAAFKGIELPDDLSAGRIRRDDLQFRRNHVERAADDQRLGVHFPSREQVAGVQGPGNLEIPDVAEVDLVQVRIMAVVVAAVVGGPVRVFLSAHGASANHGQSGSQTAAVSRSQAPCACTASHLPIVGKLPTVFVDSIGAR